METGQSTPSGRRGRQAISIAHTTIQRGVIVHRGPGFALGRFDCRPDDELWSIENWIGDRHHIVFPLTATLIRMGDREVVSDPNTVLLYNRDEIFRRDLIDPRGDHTFYAEIDEALIAEMASDPGPAAEPIRWPVVSLTVDAATYAIQWKTVRHFIETPPEDVLVSDEAILTVLGSVVRRAFGVQTTARRAGGERIVDATKRLLVENLSAPLSLSEIARRVHVSPYHLTRLFRRHTGLSLQKYRSQLRLRSSLERVAAGREPLKGIAKSLAFCSHSHFTSQFHETFGLAPTDWRRTTACELFTRTFEGSL